MKYDVAVIGAGPAGATCAAMCAQAGRATILLERSVFPREKVCGDCLNPACWPILDRLGVSERLLELPHARLGAVEFIGLGGRTLSFPLPDFERGEIAIKRSVFDQLLLTRARECGAEIRDGSAVTAIERGWTIHTERRCVQATMLIAADGRNSTVARLLGLLPAARKERVAIQTHFESSEFGERVALRFLPQGYCGLAAVGADQVNICLVGSGPDVSDLRGWAGSHFTIPKDAEWRTVAPLARSPIAPVHEQLLFVGDACRVVEPFTGEGIYYALASGELAARHLIRGDLPGYAKAHAEFYHGRLWINQLAKQAALHPRLGSLAVDLASWWPASLRFLTAKVVTEPTSPRALAQR
ncbi:MAG TPA: NAD(P)/FAD-dependent oxidoreductase [Chthoniobacteraceae bacterium]|jgi:flavin-dependent dehydrogenase|nr:NAD(P)/FAD-dependent oxidoreductase [Chthoniobacteraceae bacterium]